ncbi:hypothetical protein TWF696_006765 [Orbilia brochopaga]|uniref:F-box domain-containing protein n=1 Tax=Orbilia brochopaga TaxID=3140254 RepID=A0AAV9UT61_9PEZI
MFRIPEIVLSVIDHLDLDPSHRTHDRDTLRSLRLVNREFCQLATKLLFKDVSLVYGFNRSMQQMRGIARSPVLGASIVTLFLPSESFFPLALGDHFEVEQFPWTRLRHIGKTWRPRRPSHEYPGRPWVGYNADRSGFGKQVTAYCTALKDLLAACPNLKEIHVAFGIGSESERMEKWRIIIQSAVLGHHQKQGLDKLKISIPSLSCLRLIFPDAEGKPDSLAFPTFSLPGLKHLSIVSLEGEDLISPDAVPQAGISFPNLESYSFVMAPELLNCFPVNPFIPPSGPMTNLTTMTLTSLVFTHSPEEDETEDLSDAPLSKLKDFPALTTLNLTLIGLAFNYGRGPLHGEAKYQATWAETFEQLLKWLPKLVDVNLDRLMYARSSGRGSILLSQPAPFLPYPYNVRLWPHSMPKQPLLSPFAEDWDSFEAFREEIAIRRHEAHLSPKTIPLGDKILMRPTAWVFLDPTHIHHYATTPTYVPLLNSARQPDQ